MSGKLKVTGRTITPNDPMLVKAYCEGRQYAKSGGTITYATGVTGVIANNNAIKWTSKVPGNGLEINLVNAGISQTLSISVSTYKIYVNLATNSSGVITSTAAQVITVIGATSASNALVTAANEGASTGAVAPVVQGVNLTGSNFAQVVSDNGVVFASGMTSWTADPAGVQTRDCCALPYGGGH